MKTTIQCPKCKCPVTAVLCRERKAIQPPVILRLYKGNCPEHGEFNEQETVPYGPSSSVSS